MYLTLINKDSLSWAINNLITFNCNVIIVCNYRLIGPRINACFVSPWCGLFFTCTTRTYLQPIQWIISTCVMVIVKIEKVLTSGGSPLCKMQTSLHTSPMLWINYSSCTSPFGLCHYPEHPLSPITAHVTRLSDRRRHDIDTLVSSYAQNIKEIPSSKYCMPWLIKREYIHQKR